jgi:hypothetical protein
MAGNRHDSASRPFTIHALGIDNDSSMNCNAFRTASYMEVDPMRLASRLAATVVLVCASAPSTRGDFFHTAPVPFEVQAQLVTPPGLTPGIYQANSPGTGYVELVPPSETLHFVGSGSIVIPMIAHSTASASHPDRFYSIFDVRLRITDDTPYGRVGELTAEGSASGAFLGSLSAHHSALVVVPEGLNQAVIGNHFFHVSFHGDPVTFKVAAPDQAPSNFEVDVNVSELPPPVPEPSTLALTGLGLACCAEFARRWRRRHRQQCRGTGQW